MRPTGDSLRVPYTGLQHARGATHLSADVKQLSNPSMVVKLLQTGHFCFCHHATFLANQTLISTISYLLVDAPNPNLDQMLPKRSCARFSPSPVPSRWVAHLWSPFSWCSIEPFGFAVQQLSASHEYAVRCCPKCCARQHKPSQVQQWCPSRPNRLVGRRG